MNSTAQEKSTETLDHQTLLRFFLPLGFSATLVTLSHVIINSTLARSDQAAIVIASYSVAFSFFGIFERCAVIFRQTSSALVRDQISYRAMAKVSSLILFTIFILSISIAYTDLGKWIFTYGFGVKQELLSPTLEAYRVLMFVTLFSGIRCFYQGIIISNLKTQWMVVMMSVRLLLMAFISWIILRNGWAEHGYMGSYIFLSGMVVEALVSFIEGRLIVRDLPEKKKGHSVESKSQVFAFYRPMLWASLIAVMINPSINAALGWSEKGELAIASFAIALSVTQLFISFSSYMHQIVINFYAKDAKTVRRFAFLLGSVPSILLACISFSPLGEWILQDIMGVSGQLFTESLLTLRWFILLALLFPFLDFANGMLILRNQTKIMSISQSGNLITTVAVLAMFTFIGGGGWMGAVSQITGTLIELAIVSGFILHESRKALTDVR